MRCCGLVCETNGTYCDAGIMMICSMHRSECHWSMTAVSGLVTWQRGNSVQRWMSKSQLYYKKKDLVRHAPLEWPEATEVSITCLKLQSDRRNKASEQQSTECYMETCETRWNKCPIRTDFERIIAGGSHWEREKGVSQLWRMCVCWSSAVQGH